MTTDETVDPVRVALGQPLSLASVARGGRRAPWGWRGWGRMAGAAIASCLVATGCVTEPAEPAEEPPPPLVLPDLAGPATRPLHVLYVSVSGLTPDQYRKRGEAPPGMPVLARLADAGVYADQVVPVVPPTPYPTHATLVTGVRPGAHGVVADLRIGDRGIRSARYSHASLIRAPTLWQRATEARLRVALLGWPSTVGAAVPLLLPDVGPTRRGETWLSLLEEAATPEIVAEIRRDPELARAANAPGGARDAILVNVACHLLAGEFRPRLLLVHLSQTAPVVAFYGQESEPAAAAFARVDDEIEHLLRCVGQASPLGVAAIVVTGDHGHLPVHTQIAPNAALSRQGLLGVGRERGGRPADIDVKEWRALVRSNGGTAFVYAQTESAALLARDVLEGVSRRTRAFRIVSAEELMSHRADPEAWFGLEARPGFVFDDSPGLPILSPAARRAAAGYLPTQRAMSPGFVAWGRGFRTSRRVPTMFQTDIAPTVAQLLGLELEAAEGRALVGLLSAPPPSR